MAVLVLVTYKPKLLNAIKNIILNCLATLLEKLYGRIIRNVKYLCVSGYKR
jgi:hypothetical protein